MCKHFVEIEDGKLRRVKGKFRRGLWSFCADCGIEKTDRRKTKILKELERRGVTKW